MFEKRMLKNTIYGHEIKLTPGVNYIIKRLWLGVFNKY